MDQDSKLVISDIEKDLKLPRENGELIFENPWESKVFAMAVILFKEGVYTWNQFNEEFVKKIGEHESKNPQTEAVSQYYHNWMEAFEKILLDKDIITQEQLDKRSDEFATGKRNHVC